MAVIRKDYLERGGHSWKAVEEYVWSKFSKDNKRLTGNKWHECECCGRIANRSGNNGQCSALINSN